MLNQLKYKQLQNEFEQYKLVFNTNSDNVTEINEQVED